MDLTIEVFCANGYQNGEPHSRTIDAAQGVDRVRAEIDAFLRESPCPDRHVPCPDCHWDDPCGTCHGRGEVPSATQYDLEVSDGFRGWVPPANVPLQTIVDVANAIVRYQDTPGNIVGAWLGGGGIIEELDAAFCGCHESEVAFAKHLARTTGLMAGWSEMAVRFFNWDAWATELFRGGYWHDAGTGAVFAPSGPVMLSPLTPPPSAPPARGTRDNGPGKQPPPRHALGRGQDGPSMSVAG